MLREKNPSRVVMALEEGGWFERLPIELYASDAASGAIAKARTGVYRERSFRSFSTSLQEKYLCEIRIRLASLFFPAQAHSMECCQFNE